jgi:hypothetical protein
MRSRADLLNCYLVLPTTSFLVAPANSVPLGACESLSWATGVTRGTNHAGRVVDNRLFARALVDLVRRAEKTSDEIEGRLVELLLCYPRHKPRGQDSRLQTNVVGNTK